MRRMEVNRNNYEEFFLMYVDGELSASDEKLLEIFIKENPDLEQELVLFQQSKLLSDPAIVFDHKEMLMAQPAGSKLINLTNYEEFFLMYADHELADDERAAVEKFAAQHPKLRRELSYIAKCRMTPDPQIIFEGKESLFRHEKERRVIYFSRFNLAVAATLLLVMGFMLFRFVFHQQARPVDVVSRNISSGKSTRPEKKPVSPVTPTEVKPYNQSTASLQHLPDRKLAENLTRSSLKKKQDGQEIPEVNQTETDFIPARKSIATAITQGTRTIPSTSGISSMIENTGNPVIALNNEQLPYGNEIDQAQYLRSSQQVALVTVPYSEDGISVFAGTPAKSTMRGFFRKVSRVFEKTTRIGDEDDKKAVLIGNFQIALK